MRKHIRRTGVFLLLGFLFSTFSTFSVFADAAVFSAEFSTGLNSTFNNFSVFKNTNTAQEPSTPTVSNGRVNFANTLHFTDTTSEKYSYSRLEAFSSSLSSNAYSRFNSSNGFSISIGLSLSMTPLMSTDPEDGFGRTGFIINVRDYKGNREDNEYYICISNYQGNLAVSLVGGNRNQLSTQLVYSKIIDTISPSEYHSYLFVHCPEFGGIRLLIDGIDFGPFVENAVSHRVIEEGHYFDDFVALSLVNRSGNACLDENGLGYTATASARVDYIRIYNTQKDRVTFLGISYQEDDETLHDHYTVLDTLGEYVVDEMLISRTRVNILKYNNFEEGFKPISRTGLVDELENSNYFLFRGHGIRSSSGNGSLWLTAETFGSLSGADLRATSNIDLSNTLAALFVCCYSAASADDYNNLILAAVDEGAESAIGFNTTILCEDANVFSEEFFYYLRRGYTTEEAYIAALNSDEYASPATIKNAFYQVT